MLRLWACGRCAAEADGVPLPMPTSDRARALIGWLALHPGQHPRTAVAAALWPEVPQASARASLRTAVWAIRQAWGSVAERALMASRMSIGLSRKDIWVDVQDDPAAEGELLPGLDDDWVLVERRAHRDRQAAEFERLSAEAEGEGRVGDAVHWSRRRSAAAPYDEAAHRDLLRRLEAAGDRSGALLAAREFAQALHAELGVRPSAATRAAVAQLNAVDTAGATASSSSSASSASSAPLFGRSRESSVLAQRWRAAAQGSGQVVVLTGEAGIGKTSLLADLAQRATASGGLVAMTAGCDVGGETPFAVWLELAKTLVARVGPVPSSATWPMELNLLAPELGARLGFPQLPPAAAAPEIERLRVFEAVLRLVEAACMQHPALIAVDDAYLADRASLRLTAHISRRLGRWPTLLVLVRRDRPARAELDALLADMGSNRFPVTELEIGPIADRDVAALVSSLAAPGVRLDDAALNRVIAAAEGNPLLAVETTRAIGSGDGSPPPNLRTAVRATLGRLPDGSQALVRAMAVAGRPLTATELDGLELDSETAAEAAAEAGLLIRRNGRLGFRHGLFRDVVYADLADPAVMHARLARALGSGDPAEVAHHLTLAGRPEQAAEQWAAAARHAGSVGALPEVAQFLVRACGCSPSDGRLWLELQEAYAWLGRTAEMEHAWEQALKLLPVQELAAAWCRRGRQFRSVVCHPDAAFTAYRMAQQSLTPSATGPGRADVLIGLAWSQSVAGDPGQMEPLLAQALELLPDPPDPRVLADIAEIRILGLVRQGRFIDVGEVAAQVAPSLAHLPDRAYAVAGNAACALACVQEFEQALVLADQAVAATESVPVLLVQTLSAQAHLLARLGRAREATESIARQAFYAARLDSPSIMAVATNDAGLVALEIGEFARAATLLGDSLAAGAVVSRPTARMARAEALVRAGDADEAEAELRRAVLEPVTKADQPGTLIPRMAMTQGLIAAARDDVVLAARRFDESERGWRRLLGASLDESASSYFANMVDLGRLPVAGLIEPGRELTRLAKERALLTEVDHAEL